MPLKSDRQPANVFSSILLVEVSIGTISPPSAETATMPCSPNLGRVDTNHTTEKHVPKFLVLFRELKPAIEWG
jgi:hypothetical protein